MRRSRQQRTARHHEGGRRLRTTTDEHTPAALALAFRRVAHDSSPVVCSLLPQVYPQPGTKRWDTCAIDACIKAEGGKFTDMFGDEIDYDPNAKYDNDKGLVGSMKDHQLYVLPKPETDRKAAL